MVIAIIALLMAILMPTLNLAKKQARAGACKMNLHHWGLVWSMYTGDHNGSFPDGVTNVAGKQMGHWVFAAEPYYTDEQIRLCPMATKPWGQGQNPFVSWEATNVQGAAGYYTSYGINNWLYNPPPEAVALWGYPAEDHWRNINTRNVSRVPLFLDCFYLGGHPEPSNEPPPYNGATEQANAICMRRFCIDRHNTRTNMVFLDFAVRPVGLKELWKLRWHRKFDTSGPWTRAGGVQPQDWPEWMRRFKDY